MIASGVHFLPNDPPDTIARKALRVNLSDLAAKGAKPLGYLLCAGLGSAVDEAWLAEFARGLAEDQATFGIALLGGDTISVAAGPVLSVTAIGSVPKGRMVHRYGGCPGHALYVSGTIGAATAGLALLTGAGGDWERQPAIDCEELVARYRTPEPRLALAPALVAFASAAMDVSDGLIGDCDKLAYASGCGAVIEAGRVPLPRGLDAADADLLARLLTGGDDFEILAAVSAEREAAFRDAAEEAGVPVALIGRLTEAAGPAEVLLRGRPLSLQRRSYVHGRDETPWHGRRNDPEAGLG